MRVSGPTKQRSRSLTAQAHRGLAVGIRDGKSRGMEFRLGRRDERDKARSETPTSSRAGKLPTPNTTPTQRHAVPRAEHQRRLDPPHSYVRPEESAPLPSRATNLSGRIPPESKQSCQQAALLSRRVQFGANP
jgi:hypothetical protein